MPLINNLRKFYRIHAKCLNCNRITEQRIPMRVTIKTFLKNNMGECPNCKTSRFKEATTKEVEEEAAKRKKIQEEGRLKW